MQCAPNTCMRKNCMALLFEGRYRVEYWSDCGAFVELHQHRNHITSLSPCRQNNLSQPIKIIVLLYLKLALVLLKYHLDLPRSSCLSQ